MIERGSPTQRHGVHPAPSTVWDSGMFWALIGALVLCIVALMAAAVLG